MMDVDGLALPDVVPKFHDTVSALDEVTIAKLIAAMARGDWSFMNNLMVLYFNSVR
jgi:hypothetical protein